MKKRMMWALAALMMTVMSCKKDNDPVRLDEKVKVKYLSEVNIVYTELETGTQRMFKEFYYYDSRNRIDRVEREQPESRELVVLSSYTYDDATNRLLHINLSGKGLSERHEVSIVYEGNTAIRTENDATNPANNSEIVYLLGENDRVEKSYVKGNNPETDYRTYKYDPVGNLTERISTEKGIYAGKRVYRYDDKINTYSAAAHKSYFLIQPVSKTYVNNPYEIMQVDADGTEKAAELIRYSAYEDDYPKKFTSNHYLDDFGKSRLKPGSVDAEFKYITK